MRNELRAVEQSYGPRLCRCVVMNQTCRQTSVGSGSNRPDADARDRTGISRWRHSMEIGATEPSVHELPPVRVRGRNYRSPRIAAFHPQVTRHHAGIAVGTPDITIDHHTFVLVPMRNRSNHRDVRAGRETDRTDKCLAFRASTQRNADDQCDRKQQQARGNHGLS